MVEGFQIKFVKNLVSLSTSESTHILELISFLRLRYQKHLYSVGKLQFSDYEPLTDKQVDLILDSKTK